jgi:hypothetical protein
MFLLNWLQSALRLAGLSATGVPAAGLGALAAGAGAGVDDEGVETPPFIWIFSTLAP